jgi:hypothetical protein
MTDRMVMKEPHARVLAQAIANLIKRYQLAEMMTRGPAVEINFEILNAIAANAGTVISAAPDPSTIRDWFDTCVDKQMGPVNGG